jgi:hypothetical protein
LLDQCLIFVYISFPSKAVSIGIFNPIQSVLVADQFHASQVGLCAIALMILALFKEFSDSVQFLQAKLMASSFAVFYFFMNCGAFLGESLGPIMRQSAGFEITLIV